MEVKPYIDSGETKKQQVEQMFDRIAHRYDFLNHFLSIGIDRVWRRKAVQILSEYPTERILDVATGTGDFAIATLRINPKKVVGLDLSEQMLLV